MHALHPWKARRRLLLAAAGALAAPLAFAQAGWPSKPVIR